MIAMRRRGFTLVELLIAIIVLAIAVIATTAAITTTNVTQRLTSRRGEMATLAESKFEEIRSLIQAGDATTISSLKPLPKGSLTSDAAGYTDVVTGSSGTFRRRWMVEQGPALTEKMTVRVLWPSTGTATQQVDVVSYILVP